MKSFLPVVFLFALLVVSYGDPAPGGFIEKSNVQATRRDTFDLSFVPSTRGAFTFPAPYNTRGYRITDDSDGEVNPNGYSYWAKINHHQGSDIMYIVAAINADQGVGPSVFSLNKTSEEVTKIGPIFSGNSYASSSAESWFFFLHPANKNVHSGLEQNVYGGCGDKRRDRSIRH
eukprot:TRINITY_DN13052_c0_g1_i1.p1 TRINITY_DN13052_c0_g1~~TRINITY_DN13052_c0_g1_i1.p1  ORF type:complete len:174 (-),score=6.91 TRINITY_DN13052_c0_g1_i1:149-670(-)